MAKRPSIPCTGGCGKLMWDSPTTAKHPKCRDCRRRDKVVAPKRERKSARVYTCERDGCNRTFKAKRSVGPKYAARFCSRECASRARSGSETLWKWRCIIEWANCPGCEGPMVGQARWKYCVECRARREFELEVRRQARRTASEARRERQVKAREHIGTIRSCAWCDAPFSVRIANQNYCSRRCQKARHRGDHIERAKRFGCAFTYFDPRSIFERDSWVCGICGDPVSRDAKWPDQMCASLDHIVPLSTGGPHHPDNARLAHWLCNALRGTSDLDLRLAG